MADAGTMAINFLTPIGSLSMMMLIGCAVPTLNTKEPPDQNISGSTLSSDEIAHRFDYWQEEAMELHDMAARREREADLISKTDRTAGELVTHMRALARQLRAAAEYADEQAQETQRQVRHAMTH
jgi:hypothetical protein